MAIRLVAVDVDGTLVTADQRVLPRVQAAAQRALEHGIQLVLCTGRAPGECWYILDCKENATIIIGHNAKTKEELTEMIHEGRWSDFIREIPIKKGDFLQIDPGTVHAIKGGTLILETQQNSDITYRVYDYDRLSNGKPRELHIDKSIDVITVLAQSVSDSVKSAADPSFNLTLEELQATMNPAKYVGRAPIQVEKFLANVVNPVLEGINS